MSNLIIYNQKKNILTSNEKSILKDKYGNEFITQSFEYDLKKNVVKIKNGILKDISNNQFKIELAYINTLTNKLFGKDITADLNNKTFNKNNEPRLKGRSVFLDNNSRDN